MGPCEGRRAQTPPLWHDYKVPIPLDGVWVMSGRPPWHLAAKVEACRCSVGAAQGTHGVVAHDAVDRDRAMIQAIFEAIIRRRKISAFVAAHCRDRILKTGVKVTYPFFRYAYS